MGGYSSSRLGPRTPRRIAHKNRPQTCTEQKQNTESPGYNSAPNQDQRDCVDWAVGGNRTEVRDAEHDEREQKDYPTTTQAKTHGREALWRRNAAVVGYLSQSPAGRQSAMPSRRLQSNRLLHPTITQKSRIS